MTASKRRIGVNIFMLMNEKGISREQLAEKLGYSFRDICRLTEGRLLLAPNKLKKVAEALGTSIDSFLVQEEKDLVPELQYMKKFSDSASLDKVLDLMDEYIELKESL